MSVMFGGTVVIEPSFLFPIKILQKIEEEKVTGFPIVPTILSMLLDLETLKQHNLSSLRYISNTGAALPVDHIKNFRKIFPKVQVFSMFGLTECKRICYLEPEDIDKKLGSVGKAMPNCEVFLVDENGNQVTRGEIGELVVRGTNVMRGYWNAPELTAKVYRNGSTLGEKLLYTGDYFRMDEDGYLYFIGRKDDMIKTKGERVSPKEIENILCGMKDIKEAAVIGLPDRIFGQVIKAFIVKSNDSNVESREVLLFCSNNMESFMIPKYIEFLEELPKSPNGKIDKKKLKELNTNLSQN
jgi:acyl-CoA synthetase (AMP-forming)/AMP-acid ligase II